MPFYMVDVKLSVALDPDKPWRGLPALHCADVIKAFEWSIEREFHSPEFRWTQFMVKESDMIKAVDMIDTARVISDLKTTSLGQNIRLRPPSLDDWIPSGGTNERLSIRPVETKDSEGKYVNLTKTLEWKPDPSDPKKNHILSYVLAVRMHLRKCEGVE